MSKIANNAIESVGYGGGVKRVQLQVPAEYEPTDADADFMGQVLRLIRKIREDQTKRIQDEAIQQATPPSRDKLDAAQDLVNILFDHQDELEEVVDKEKLDEIEQLMMDING